MFKSESRLVFLFFVLIVCGGASCNLEVSNPMKQPHKTYTVITGNNLTYKELRLKRYYAPNGETLFVDKDGKTIEFFGTYIMKEE